MNGAEQPPVALTIAGSDSGGGAGIQADLKTFAVHGVFGTSVITALTAQNTAEVRAISPVPPEFVAAQLDAVLDDLPVAAVKTGMLGTPENVALVASRGADLPNLVVDPVLVSSSGHALFTGDVAHAYLDKLFPLATVATPNLREAAVLVGRRLSTVDDVRAAAGELGRTGARYVVIKGGHLRDTGEATDVVWFDGRTSLLTAPWIDTPNNHGTGCTFAAAAAAAMAAGAKPAEALQTAKDYVFLALKGGASLHLGHGHGPLDHFAGQHRQIRIGR
jgi:hydroxymethylpyrimidine/phosphomethylpyrimidine kinase